MLGAVTMVVLAYRSRGSFVPIEGDDTESSCSVAAVVGYTSTFVRDGLGDRDVLPDLVFPAWEDKTGDVEREGMLDRVTEEDVVAAECQDVEGEGGGDMLRV